jgi:1-acyl-sn-glycerol-3-phosphate acyltransferase
MRIVKSLIVWAIGICYMAVLFPLTLIIWLLVLPFDRQRVTLHWLLVYQSCILSALLPVWKIKIEGREKGAGEKTLVIISNHQSMVDILLINCLRYRYRWISKIENRRVPVLGWYLKMAGYITVDRADEKSKAEMLERSYRSLKEGISIMIFPEGTRSGDRETGFFKRGAFQLALEAEVPILPVIIYGSAGILTGNGLLTGSGHHILIRVLDPVHPRDFGTDSPEILAGKFQALMTSELKRIREQTTPE